MIQLRINWLRWHWWRTKGCYHFRTCIRCISPFHRKGGLCKACEQDWPGHSPGETLTRPA